jgi:aspartyl-tRNA(Asn)/glutamyl-tRNA(Gln) amidotransferase subunit A
MQPLHELSVTELSPLLARREVSPVELADAVLERIEDADGAINAFCALDADLVRAQAKEAEHAIGRDGPRSRLHGIPVSVKDLLFTKDLATTGGSRVYERFVPEEDDVVVERIRSAGGVILGKTNVPEFGYGVATWNALWGVTRNPWNLALTPGGSSGGSAAAVAAGMGPLSVGSDGGGSIRVPSAFCGVFGMKPTFGVVPVHPGCRDTRYPGFSGWETVEHIGPIARTVADSALLLEVMAGADPRDRHSMHVPDGWFAQAMEPPDLTGCRIAWTVDWGGRIPVDGPVRELVTRALPAFEEAGAKLEEAHPATDDTMAIFGPIVALDADVPGMRRMIEANPGFVDERIVELMWTERDPEALYAAPAARRRLYEQTRRFFDHYDLLITPTAPSIPFPAERRAPETIAGEPVVDVRATLCFTLPFNLTGNPAASVPCGWTSEGLPIGMQIVGSHLADPLVLRGARAFECIRPWADKRPRVP